MNSCVAQTRPATGDIQRNVAGHKALISLAVSAGADAILFPELSLTGYEPELAGALATSLDDSRFNDFQILSDDNRITIGVGMPIRSKPGILIGMLLFQPGQPRHLYAKQHLHTDEYPYFVQGQQPVFLERNKHKTALAICYELSVPIHSQTAYQQGADLYIASVAKSREGVEKAAGHLSGIARTYSMTVLMANSVGLCDHFMAGGQSAIWNSQGQLVGQLNDTNEGILLINHDTQVVRSLYL